MMSSFSLSQSDSEEELFRQRGGRVFRRDKIGRRGNIDKNPKQSYYELREVPSVTSKDRDTFSDEPETEVKKTDGAPIYPEDDEPSTASEIDDDRPNHVVYFIIYSLIGYVTGIVIVLLWYWRHYEKYGSDINLKWVFIVLLIILIIMGCYNATFRCCLVLLAPNLAGYVGRLLIICIAFYVALSGPGTNMVHNTEITMHSLACGQSLLKRSLMPMHQIMGEPVFPVEESVYVCLAQVRKLMEHLDENFQKIEAPIVRIHSSYRSCIDWLQHQQLFFENQMGSPYDRCMAAGSRSFEECQLKFPDDKALCDLGERFEWFCAKLKDLPSFFDPHLQLQQEQQIDEHVFMTPLQSFALIRSIFEVSITFDHTQKLGDDHPGINLDVELEIGKRFGLQMKILQLVFLWVYLNFIMLTINLILVVIYFHFNYLGSLEYSNRYLNHAFHVFNKKQSKKLGFGALPLRSTETKRYTELKSCHVLAFEKYLSQHSFIFMVITTVQLFTICFIDYSLYSLLNMMNYHSELTAELQPSEYTKIVVKDGGMIGYIIAGLVKAFEPLSKNLFIDIQNCLPIPRATKYFIYWEIFILDFLAWILVFIGPFIMRLRNRIMSFFYPLNNQARAEHLHMLILRDRAEFIVIARRRARAINLYYTENRTLMVYNYIIELIYILTCGKCGSYMNMRCKTCEVPLAKNDLVSCDKPGCRGVYCQPCFIESNCLCILCSASDQYGDYESFSDVEDSSDDSEPHPYRQGHPQKKFPAKEEDKSA